MGSVKRRRSLLSPQEKLARSIRAKRQFRALVRLTAANRAWLEDDDEQLGDNIQKNIRILTRKKEQKSPLSLPEKALLNKPKELRTEEDKNFLMRCIGRLKCFRRYPAEVKDRLPGVMYYLYLGPNRVLMRQGHDPVNAYVLLAGEVGVTQTYYDRLLKETCTREFPGMGEGSLVGEVALLTGIKRTATIKTVTACEFMFLSKEDFDVVLKQTVAKRWQEVQDNMACFNYFNAWNEIDIRESCIMSRRKDFGNDDVILSQTVGLQDYAHFVTKGRCYIIEVIFVEEVCEDGVKSHRLLEGDEVPAELVSKVVHALTLDELRKLGQDTGKREEPQGKSTPSEGRSLRASRTKSLLKNSQTTEPNLDQRTSKMSRISFAPDNRDLGKQPKKARRKVKAHFIRICTFNRLACFNLGENRQNRIYVADLFTECFLLPRYLLFEKSRTIFSRVKLFLDKMVPSTKQLYNNYLADLRWNRYKEKIKEDLLATRGGVTTNSVHNVPYSIRMENDLEYNVLYSKNF